MTEDTVLDGDVIVRAQGSLRRLTLNRPQTINALTLGMAETMTLFLRQWANDLAVSAVLIDGAGERGLCAGGDLRALYDAKKSQGSFPAHYWATEYKLDVLIARYPKPVVALMTGLVMGGGVGISAHASHRVVTDRSAVAMPECIIGLVPDVGASFILARAPGSTGMHLALTGARMTAADAIYSGFADIHVAATGITGIPEALADCRDAASVTARLRGLSTAPAPGRLSAAQSWIDACYRTDTVEDVAERLRNVDHDDARAAHEAIRKGSPTSLKVTLQNVREAASFKRVEQSFQQDYRIVLACHAGHDFIEGIRAAIVDKDRNPKWQPARLEDVTPDIVERHFKSVGALELQFP
jgi:enoyl-CoA hydratase